MPNRVPKSGHTDDGFLTPGLTLVLRLAWLLYTVVTSVEWCGRRVGTQG